MRSLSYFILFSVLLASPGLCAQNQSNSKSKATITKKQFKQLNEQYELLQKEIDKMEQQRVELVNTFTNYDSKLKELTKKLQQTEQAFDDLLPATDMDQAQPSAATRQQQATQMSFNLQYLQLQNLLQNQSRQFVMVSNTMKAKLETASKSIKNSR